MFHRLSASLLCPTSLRVTLAEALVTHLEGNGVEFYQFAFRWMNCLLMRELPFQLVIRLWDTCLAERDGCVTRSSGSRFQVLQCFLIVIVTTVTANSSTRCVRCAAAAISSRSLQV
jgi:hypothetical protein